MPTLTSRDLTGYWGEKKVNKNSFSKPNCVRLKMWWFNVATSSGLVLLQVGHVNHTLLVTPGPVAHQLTKARLVFPVSLSPLTPSPLLHSPWWHAAAVFPSAFYSLLHAPTHLLHTHNMLVTPLQWQPLHNLWFMAHPYFLLNKYCENCDHGDHLPF